MRLSQRSVSAPATTDLSTSASAQTSKSSSAAWSNTHPTSTPTRSPYTVVGPYRIGLTRSSLKEKEGDRRLGLLVLLRCGLNPNDLGVHDQGTTDERLELRPERIGTAVLFDAGRFAAQGGDNFIPGHRY